MKKILLTYFLFCISFTMFSQENGFRFGVKAGTNFSSIAGDDVEDATSRTGLHIGAVANFPISERFSVQPEVVYSMRGFKDGEFTIKTDYLDVHAKASVNVAEGLSLQTGPIIGLNISASADDGNNDGEIADIEQIVLGLLVGAQYELPIGLFFNLHYDIGFTQIIDNGFDAKNRNLALSVGWFFN